MARKHPDPKDVEVGRRVRAFRLNKGLSQEKLGDRLHPVERKSDAQVLIGEELLDNHSNARS